MENIKDFKSEYSYMIKDKIYTDFVGMDKIKVEIPMVSSITQNYITIYVKKIKENEYKISDNLQMIKSIRNKYELLKDIVYSRESYLRVDDDGEVYTMTNDNLLLFNFNMFLRDYIILEGKIIDSLKYV